MQFFIWVSALHQKKRQQKKKMSVNNQTNGNIQLTHFRFNASNWILVALLMQLSVDENEKPFHSKELFKENQISFSLKWINIATRKCYKKNCDFSLSLLFIRTPIKKRKCANVSGKHDDAKSARSQSGASKLFNFVFNPGTISLSYLVCVSLFISTPCCTHLVIGSGKKTGKWQTC